MSTIKFREFVSIEHIGIKKISQFTKKEWISDTAHNILLYVAIVGVNGDLIQQPPVFKLDCSILSTTDDNELTTKEIQPSKAPKDTPTPGIIVTDNGTKFSITNTLNEQITYPVSGMEGFLYFTIEKTKKQIIVKKDLIIE